MTNEEIRALRPDEIECRVQQVTKKGVMLLLYKDARCDMAILDETFTPFGWQRRHSVVNNKEFCTVSVRSADGEWIDKQDCGTESNTEKEKGESSDAFKRACFNWGIGRELYTKIFIFVSVPTEKDGNKWVMKDKYAKFAVSSIETDNKAKKILKLAISDKSGKVVFTWDNEKPPVYEETKPQEKPQAPIKRPQEQEPPKEQLSMTEGRWKSFWDRAGADGWTKEEVEDLAGGDISAYDVAQVSALWDKMQVKRKESA